MHPKPPPAAMQTSPWDDELSSRIAARFSDAIPQFSVFAGQQFLVAGDKALIEVLRYLHDEEQFDFLVDLTAVDYLPRESGPRFELVYVLYSFERNRRIRVKIAVGDGVAVQSATSIYPGANWLEREVYDLFGIVFENHPDLRRILMPDDWTGHPLRKDYGILQADERWVRAHLGIDNSAPPGEPG